MEQTTFQPSVKDVWWDFFSEQRKGNTPETDCPLLRSIYEGINFNQCKIRQCQAGCGDPFGETALSTGKHVRFVCTEENLSLVLTSWEVGFDLCDSNILYF